MKVALEVQMICRVCLQEVVAAFTVTVQQVQLSLKPGQPAGERLPSPQSLLSMVQHCSKAFASLMKLVAGHDSNHLVYQAAIRSGGKMVDQFLKVR